MKHTMKSVLSIFLAVMMIFCMTACKEEKVDDLWASATYTENTTLGEGTKTITLEVTANEKTVVFTVKTDAETVGAALLEHNLIAGEEGAYGLYVKIVNGMLADYDVDQTYWSFTIAGETAMTGVDQTELVDGTVYGLVRTK